MNISEPSPGSQPKPLWRLAFRAGFLLAALFAVTSMIRWLYWILWPARWDFSLFPLWWHAHEMVFGFAMPVVAGFLLTAVAAWTGIAGTSGVRLKLLFGLWLAARLLLWFLPGLPVLAWLADTGFIPLLLFELTRRVWAVRQWRNMLFPPVLLALGLLNTASYWSTDNPLLATRLHYSAIWMVTVLVVIIGGRVTPLFTGNRLGLKIPPLPSWFEYLCIGSTALIGVLTLWPGHQVAPLLTGLCLATGILHLARLFHWQGWKTTGVPLLWSMHLAYLCIPLALFALAWTGGEGTQVKNIIHLLAVGTIAGMILAMMARVSLGHTGRPLEVPAYLALAFALLFAAAILRAFLPLVDVTLTPWAWRLSAGLWIVAFGLFLLRYLPVLTQPRADGKPG